MNTDLFANFADELETSLPQMAGAISTGMGLPLPGGEVVADVLKRVDVKTSLPKIAGAVSTSMGFPGGEVVADMLKKLLASETDGIQAVEAFVKAAQNRNEYPILIIDEANLVFSPKDANGQYKNKPVLDKLVGLTKSRGQMMLLLTSSEHAYPYKLARIWASTWPT